MFQHPDPPTSFTKSPQSGSSVLKSTFFFFNPTISNLIKPLKLAYAGPYRRESELQRGFTAWVCSLYSKDSISSPHLLSSSGSFRPFPTSPLFNSQQTREQTKMFHSLFSLFQTEIKEMTFISVHTNKHDL